ncbi:MAG TPA: cyclic nucleotide-binding protein, partial [Caulobacteraceae bacterium]
LGPIVGVDVGRGRSIEAKDIAASSVWRWLLSGDWRRGPPIVSLLMRSATVRGGPELAQSHAATDVLVQPEVDAIEIRDWKGGFEPGVKAGYEATLKALDSLEHPVIDLRRRQSLDEAALAKRRASMSAVGRWA